MAWLDANPPVRSQWFHRRQWPDGRPRALTGATVLHTSESIMDSVGPDTGAENVARFIQGRATPGSYHDLVDSDSRVGPPLVGYDHGAFHDGTGSNNWALSIAFACQTTDWARMGSGQRAGFLRQGALAFVDQQLYRRATGAPLTRTRYITKFQSDAGESGFCCHGWRDPGRRTDPGVTAPHRFPFEEFLAACRVALGERMPNHPDASARKPTMKDEPMILIRNSKGTVVVLGDNFAEWVATAEDHRELQRILPQAQITDDLFNRMVAGARSVASATGAIRDDLADEEPAKLPPPAPSE